MCEAVTYTVKSIINAPVNWRSEAKIIIAIAALALILVALGIREENYALRNIPGYQEGYYKKIYFTTAALVVALTTLVYTVRHCKHS